ncbi:hypothetical protein BDFB_003520 [Asbolus verrucosus]|uniref:Uncharacterized protein n=1 Tax=Asbolus verrucosus TaxID=1661398 RepID=A0A482WCY2_ASBVE|nr:hypothetical protein BDFB_003520 [Asbolus verrucosus]
MSYYKPSFSQTAAMTRGRGYSPRGSYRGSSGRGSSWGGGRGGYTPRGGGGSRFDSSFSNSFDSRSKYGSSSERYSGSRGHDDFRKSYRMVSRKFMLNVPLVHVTIVLMVDMDRVQVDMIQAIQNAEVFQVTDILHRFHEEMNFVDRLVLQEEDTEDVSVLEAHGA